ncbi:hypothetical protein [Aquabacterium sp.]|uniref:hypothetical protein n=1 Tax=Aquabacterium sp. TaxID=1872578 RepID=UPI0035B3D842
MRLRLLALTCLTLLAACDQLGIESPQKELERKEADAKAVGSACRQAGRAIEDCYNLNPKASKSAVFAGWREMDEYMRENKLDVVAPTVPPLSAPKPKSADDEADSGASAKPDEAASKDHGTKKPRPKDKS